MLALFFKRCREDRKLQSRSFIVSGHLLLLYMWYCIITPSENVIKHSENCCYPYFDLLVTNYFLYKPIFSYKIRHAFLFSVVTSVF